MTADAPPGAAGLDPAAVELAPSPAWCRAWTERVDHALRQWAGDLGADRGLAVVALGGYARRELCPASDVDLLLLHGRSERADLADLVRRLCYPLWDAGLQVGYAVHTPADAVRAAGERLASATALVDRRLVAGDRGLLDDLASRAEPWLRRSAPRWLEELAAAAADRRARAGRRPGMLEPHLKDGAGGLRDLHGLRWAAAALLGEASLDALVSAHYLGAGTRRDLAAASATLLGARCALHLVRGRRSGAEVDRLRLDLQDEAAERMGLDGEALLRRVVLATRAVAHAADRTWPLLREDAKRGRRLRLPGRGRAVPEDDTGEAGIRVEDGAVVVDPGLRLADVPSLGLRAVAAAGRLGLGLDRHSAERLTREVAAAGELPWDDDARAALLDLLAAGPTAAAALADLDQCGLLVAHLPEWGRVRGHPQRNPLHTYDLDTHLFQTVAELVAMGRGGDGGGEREALLYEQLPDPGALLLAAMLHDVGKPWPGDHSETGADLAAAWVRHMGFPRADLIARLVRHHLLLPAVATGRDLDDPGELRAVADAVTDVETLDGLYLLSLADARATGPTVHSPWKDGLIATLHARVRRLLAGEDVAVPAAEDVAAEAERAAPGDRGLHMLLAIAPAGYLSAARVPQVLAHAALLPATGLRAAVRPGPAEATATVSVTGADRRGLVADCAGVLAASGLEILQARMFTARDGTALDWFVVRARAGAQPDWARLTADLERAGEGLLDVPAGVNASERRIDERPPALAAPVPVEVAVDPRPGGALVEVRAPDGPALLYRLTRVLADHDMDLAAARVTTQGPEARDAFTLRDDLDATRRATLAAALRTAAAR